MAQQKRAGLIELKVGGEIQSAKGDFTYNLGKPKREAIVGSDGMHGFREVPQVAFIEGAITDRDTLDVSALVTMRDVTVTLTLGNEKMVVLRDAWFAAEGTANTGEAEIAVRWEGASADEV